MPPPSAHRETALPVFPFTTFLAGFWTDDMMSLQAKQNHFVALFFFFALVSRTTVSTVVAETSWQKQCEEFVSPETMWGRVGGDFVPKRGACPPLIISDYIDHLALTQGFTHLNNLKHSLTSLALETLAFLPSLFVDKRACSKPSTGAQPRNEPPSKQTK